MPSTTAPPRPAAPGRPNQPGTPTTVAVGCVLSGQRPADYGEETGMRSLAVDDVMERDVAVLRPDTGYKDIVRLLLAAHAGAAPVVGTDDRVLGVVTEADLLHKAEFSGVGPGLLDRRAIGG